MTGGEPAPPGLDRLEEQVRDILEGATGTIEILSRIDFGFVEDQDQYANWHASSPLPPMIRALLFKELQGLSYSELYRYLSDNNESASAFGFEEMPSRPTFGRTWSNRFDDDLRGLIEEGAERIRKLGRQQGILIGSRGLQPRERKNVSKRTEDRFIAKKTEEVTREMQRLVFPVVEFDRAENAKYDTDAFLELQSHLGLSHSAAESGCKLFAQDTHREGGAPDADTHLYNIKRLSQEHIGEMLHAAIGRMTNEAKRHLEFNRPTEVAIDMTYIAYYGKRDEMEMVMGAPPAKSYDWCHKFATLTVVGENVKLTLAVCPVQKGYYMGEIVRDLLAQAREHVNIGMVYADREFCAVDAMLAFEEAGVGYVIPSPKNPRVKAEIERMQRDVKVINDYAMSSFVRGGRENQKHAETNLVLLPSTKDPEKTVAFTTNEDVSDETLADRIQAKGWVDRYSRRWGIENSYKTIKDFLAWTTSKNFVVRYFYFGFAVLLYNMWLLVDLIVQLSLDVEHRYKPRVTAKRFLNMVRKYLVEPG